MTDKRKGILNYTTEVTPIKTASEVMALLAQKGAQSIAIDYADGEPVGLMFRLAIAGQDAAFKLPCNVEGVYQALNKNPRVPPRYSTREQAKRVAWRILKDWVEAQLAIIESGQAQTAEVFLPYLLVGRDQTLFQKMITNPDRLLTAGDVE